MSFEAIDNASEGSIITLSKENIALIYGYNKALVDSGDDKKAKIIGDGKGSVISTKNQNVVIKILVVKIVVLVRKEWVVQFVFKVNNITIENNHISILCCLGLNFEQVNESKCEIILSHLKNLEFIRRWN